MNLPDGERGNVPVNASDSAIVKHIDRELRLLGEAEGYIRNMVRIGRIFDKMGHSGTSAVFCAQQLASLLNFEPLSPITDNPDEWIKHSPDLWDGINEVWQNVRDCSCFSADGGKSYYSLSNPDLTLKTQKWISPVAEEADAG